MKIAYFWTGDFSANILESLLTDFKDDIDVELVVSQPDKRVGRKKILQKTKVKVLAEKYDIEVLQPERLIIRKDSETYPRAHSLEQVQFTLSSEWQKIDKLKKLNLDFIVVVAYGKIIPEDILSIPKHWCINIHWSILPAYRWASPIQEAIKNWDKQTWLTIMYMDKKMDEGDILKIEKIDIDKEDKTSDIFKKFEKIWPKLLVETLKKVITWIIKWQKQDNKKASYCSKINKQDWEVLVQKETINQIYNKFRAYYPWPWIFTYYNWKKLNIEDCYLSNIENNNIWSVIKIDKKTIWIVCSDKKILILKQVKLEWKKSMDITSFINWNKEFLNYKFN